MQRYSNAQELNMFGGRETWVVRLQVTRRASSPVARLRTYAVNGRGGQVVFEIENTVGEQFAAVAVRDRLSMDLGRGD